MDKQRKDEVKTTAKIGPMRAVASDWFAPPHKKEAEAEQQEQTIKLPVKLVAQLRNILVSDHERQNVLTYTIEKYSSEKRLEYMRFTEDIKIDHSWLGLLSWWNHRLRDKETQYTTIFEEKTRIEAFNGVEKVMGVARVYEPTPGDTETVCKIMKEYMTTPYRCQFEHYLRRYNIPKCLRVLKLWLWDVQDGRQKAPDSTEDADTRMRRVKQLMTITHKYDGVSKFPRLTRKNRRIMNVDMMMAVSDDAGRSNKRCYQQSLPPLITRPYATKIQKIDLSSDDEVTGEERKKGGSITPPPPPPPPPPPGFEPVTPPPPPPPQDGSDDDGSSRPPRLHRPKPTDPRINRHEQRSPLSPATLLSNKEEAAKRMGLESYVVRSVVRNMSEDDWCEFLTKRKYGRSLIKDLQSFLNEKYCNEEYTLTQNHYGRLCNMAMYPMYYPPYEEDFPARGGVPSSWRVPQKTFFRREFADGSFPVYVSDEEYDRMMFTEREFCVEDHSQPRGYYNTHTLVENPAKYFLRTVDDCGNEVILRNTPREEH